MKDIEDAKKYQPFNQVEYKGCKGSIALITSQTTGYCISLWNGQSTETFENIEESDLSPIPISANILKNCNPREKGLYYSFYFDSDKSKAEVWPNGCYRFTINGEQTYDGQAEYLHELQNLIKSCIGYPSHCDWPGEYLMYKEER